MTDLSHFHGMPFKRIVMHGDDEFEWAIELVDGTQIRNYDGRRTALPEIPEGYGLMTTILDKHETKIRFGITPTTQNPHPPTPVDISLTPTKYAIAGGRVKGEVYPQMLDPEERNELAHEFTSAELRARQRHEELPPDPSEDRVKPEDAESHSEPPEGEDGVD